MGMAGRYGLYEALDFTSARLPLGRSSAVIQSFMAHHQGMSFLALAAVLLERPMHRRFEADPQFQATAEFCAKYDAAAFDPDYDTLPLSFFEPMMERLFAQPKHSIYKAAMLEHSPA